MRPISGGSRPWDKGGGGHPDPEIRGGGRGRASSPKKNFSALRASFWSKNKGGQGPPGPFPGSATADGGLDVISCLPPCLLYCIEGEFEQIITKFRVGIKDNNNWLQSKFHWLFIWYFLQILSSYFYPIQTLLFNCIDTLVLSKSLGYLRYLFGVYIVNFSFS